jgi:DNA-binding GntR family transcriptional regulator
MVTFDPPKSLAEVVTNRLRQEIVEGEFEFGQALSESKIAARYGVSRTPVREAFAGLGLEGLVRTEPQHGTFVFVMDRDQFAKLSETRAILETAALRIALEHARPELLRQWKRIVKAMSAAVDDGDSKRYSNCDGEFHAVLFTLADNTFLVAAGHSFAAKMAAVRNRLGAEPEHMKRSFREHKDLLSLVTSGDTAGAVTLLEKHIRDKGEDFWTIPARQMKSRWEKITELAGATLPRVT